MRRAFACMTIAALTAVVGCGDDDADDTTTDTTTPTDMFVPALDMSDPPSETRTLRYTFEGLPTLGDGYEYEGWIIVDGTPVTAGRFDIVDGAPSPATYEIDAAMADAATMYVLTIEPSVGDDPAPSDTHVVAGPFESGTATLTIGHMAALGDDFTSAAGTFFLATPTSAAMDDDALGIWFIDASSGSPAAGLDLPALPPGWVYEGWVVDVSGANPVPISTGTFTATDAADSDGAGEAAGDLSAPPYPGQDFIDPARDLSANHMAVISIEPMPDDSAAPFQLKPLAVMIGGETGMANAQTLGNAIGANGIAGTARFE